MLLSDLSAELERFYEIGIQRQERNALVQCFGIQYADVILEQKISPEDIVKHSSLKDTTYSRELRKGIKLSKYVVLKSNF